MKKLVLPLILFFLFSEYSFAQNYALSFDGVNDYGRFPSSLQPSGTSFTAEAWVYIDPTGGEDQKILMNLTWSGGAKGFGLTIYHNAFGYHFTPSIYIAGNSYFAPDSDPIATSTWTHVAMTWSQGGNISSYVNGQLVGSTATSNTYVNSGVYTYMGMGDAVSWAPFKGKIDEIRIWSTVRTQTELANNMYTQFNGDESGLTTYYKMSAGTGTTISDNKIGGSINGTIYNGVLWDLNTILPIHFNDFSIKPGTIGNELFWNAPELSSPVTYQVQRSYDGKQFTTIGSVSSTYGHLGQASYRFVDNYSEPGIVFYRVCEYGMNGSFYYSKIISVPGAKTGAGLRIINNPVVNGQLQVVIPEPSVINIFSANGSMVKGYPLMEGCRTIDISTLNKGSYILRSRFGSIAFLVQ